MNIVVSKLKETLVSNYLILLFAIAVYAIHFYFFHAGYFGYDDIEYCRIATSWIKGDFTHDSLYNFRYGAIIPLYFSYLIFGISDFANFIAYFISFIFILFISLLALNKFSIQERWAAALFLIFAPMHLMYVEKPMPDIIVELAFFVSFLSYYHLRFSSAPFKFTYLFWSLGIIIAFLSKESILIFYPYFLFFFIADFIQKKNKKFWLKSTMVLAVFGVLYLIFNQVVTGHFLSRVHKIFEGQYFSPCSYDLLPSSALLNRILYELFYELCRNLFLIPLAFVFLLFKNTDKRFRFIAFSFLSLLLLSNFMTISYTSYAPLCTDIRHYMFLLPVGALLMAHGVQKISHTNFYTAIPTLILLIGMFLLSLYKQYENTWFFYIPLLIALGIAFYNKQIMLLLLTIAFVSVYIQNALYSNKIGYKSQKALNSYLIHVVSGKKYIITDRVNADYGMLQCKFDTTTTRFIEFKNYKPTDMRVAVPQYIILNGMTLYLSAVSWEILPDFARTAQEKLPLVFSNEAGEVYQLK